MPLPARLVLDVKPLIPYSRIIVTGPQRSGTTFVARAISKSLSMAYMDEDEISVRDEDKLKSAIRFKTSFVLQAPGCSHLLHKLLDPITAIVWVRRPLAEILASEKRVGWGGGEVELRQYKEFDGKGCPRRLSTSAEVKTWHWDSWQKSACHLDTYEISYDCEYLQGHDLWLDGASRSRFNIRQWAK